MKNVVCCVLYRPVFRVSVAQRLLFFYYKLSAQLRYNVSQVNAVPAQFSNHGTNLDSMAFYLLLAV